MLMSCIRRRGRLFAAVAAGLYVGTSLLFAGNSPAHAAGSSAFPTISVMIDGKGITSDVNPVIQDGRMLVPIRVIAENTGASISYEQSNQRVLIDRGDTQISLYVGKPLAYVNGKKVKLDTNPILSKGRTLLPVRFVSQTLGYQVNWDNKAEVAVVSTHKEGYQKSPSTVDPSKVYVVQDGDTVNKIASAHDTNVQKLLSWNDLDDDELFDGQLLILPDDAKKARHSIENELSASSLLEEGKVFPLLAGEYEPYDDSYGSGRDWVNGKYVQNARTHEGIDIMAAKGTPVYAVTDGWINRLGWNQYGGWRVNITDASNQYRLYYAHLEAYAPGLELGGTVKAGQLLGFVGNTGYGPVGTSGLFETHLHFGLYKNDSGQAFNPYPYLEYWEKVCK